MSTGFICRPSWFDPDDCNALVSFEAELVRNLVDYSQERTFYAARRYIGLDCAQSNLVSAPESSTASLNRCG